MFSNDFKPKISPEYFCEKCDYKTSKKSNMDNHYQSAKHMKSMIINDFKPGLSSKYICQNCHKEYKENSGLWRHNKNKSCTPSIGSNTNDAPSISIDTALIVELLKENKELREMMIEQNKQVLDIAKNSGNTTNTTNNTINNTTNNRFNLNVFLNETCKDAINLNDFIQSIELSINDFINTGEVGYVKGISNIMVERIRDMEPHIRPIHCTDLKREIVYVKDSNKWTKEDDNKTHLRKAVKIVANKNKDLVHPWREENPNYEILDTPECNKFFEYTKASLGGYGKEEDIKFDNKIISNILKETVIDKNLLEN